MPGSSEAPLEIHSLFRLVLTALIPAVRRASPVAPYTQARALWSSSGMWGMDASPSARNSPTSLAQLPLPPVQPWPSSLRPSDHFRGRPGWHPAARAGASAARVPYRQPYKRPSSHPPATPVHRPTGGRRSGPQGSPIGQATHPWRSQPQSPASACAGWQRPFHRERQPSASQVV